MSMLGRSRDGRDHDGSGPLPGQGIYRITRPVPRVVVVELMGEHDLETTPHLRDVLFSLVDVHDLVVLDLTSTEFIDSSVLLMIVQTNRLAATAETSFRLVVEQESLIHRLLELSNVLERIDVAPSRDAALREL
jgi:anti-anti-sigma factor